MRTFLGVKVHSNALLKIQEELKQLDPGANHTLPGNIHLTLVFLGELSPSQVQQVTQILKSLSFQAFEIEINKIKKLHDMIIAEVKPKAELMALQEQLLDSLLRLNLQLENRRYYPHITLARKSNLEIIKPVQIVYQAQEVTLFASERINQVLTYTPLCISKLKE
ncbi:MAG: RNA 2',3'-cyclic phosphodiesterase [Acholeplasmataceae bacterium]|jgi:2'-5' RNA ligase|nr:RNA 2',3'-cyclic phosphodiesterase [Acholeplasmataceae bacterium]